MKNNVGSTDRVVRLLVALTVAGLLLAGAVEGTLGVFLGILASILVLTSLVSFCPLYALFGISTRRKGSTVDSQSN
jgi:ABC-type transport system involved in cytochrome bd biosynthesis fused ATPase/permease subunit